MSRRRLVPFALALALGVVVLGAVRFARSPDVERENSEGKVAEIARKSMLVEKLAELAITRLDLDQAEKMLVGRTGAEAARVRARLSIYRADCEGAALLLESSAARGSEEGRSLADFAERCAGATVSGLVAVDEQNGIWLRLQDRADEVFVPLLVDTIVRAREVIERDLGARLPRPLRLDLVRDLFSLSAVSGLPLEAAETTGTVAVARYGRVTMLSPRATERGYPWQDTLAHEITHLVLTRSSWDRAPLWLQEGVAKREETRWRDARAFDRTPDPSIVAYRAERRGEAVGVDRLGPSIAMLPTADAAAIAFAEVTSFVEFLLDRNGAGVLPALLRDLRVTRDAETALRGVSGLGLGEWQRLWRARLGERFEAGIPEDERAADAWSPREQAQVLRLVELLFVEGHPEAARLRGAPEIDRAPHSAALRFFVGRAALAAGGADFARSIPDPASVRGAHGGYLALVGRSRADRSTRSHDDAGPGDQRDVAQSVSHGDPRTYFAHARALDPLLPEVACEGVPWHEKSREKPGSDAVPDDPVVGALCAHARSLPVRGAE